MFEITEVIIFTSLMYKWLKSVAKSPNTKRNYLHDLNAYCAFTGKTPDELIIEAEADRPTSINSLDAVAYRNAIRQKIIEG